MMTDTTIPDLSDNEISVLELLADGEHMFEPGDAVSLNAAVRLFDKGFLLICPPGDRYKLSPLGYAVSSRYGAKRARP